MHCQACIGGKPTTARSALCHRGAIAVPLLSPHAAELAALVAQLVAALRALAAMVEGSVSLHRWGSIGNSGL